jgi:hypothetical protein
MSTGSASGIPACPVSIPRYIGDSEVNGRPTGTAAELSPPGPSELLLDAARLAWVQVAAWLST